MRHERRDSLVHALRACKLLTEVLHSNLVEPLNMQCASGKSTNDERLALPISRISCFGLEFAKCEENQKISKCKHKGNVVIPKTNGGTHDTRVQDAGCGGRAVRRCAGLKNGTTDLAPGKRIPC